MPEGYDTRLTKMFPGAYVQLRLYAFEAHDLALAKLGRDGGRGREDVKYLARAGYIDTETLQQRYQKELRPYLANVERHDLTVRLWVEMLQEISGSPS